MFLLVPSSLDRGLWDLLWNKELLEEGNRVCWSWCLYRLREQSLLCQLKLQLFKRVYSWHHWGLRWVGSKLSEHWRRSFDSIYQCGYFTLSAGISTNLGGRVGPV